MSNLRYLFNELAGVNRGIGSAIQDVFNGNWPGPEFRGDKYVSIPAFSMNRFRVWGPHFLNWKGEKQAPLFYYSMRWSQVQVCMLEFEEWAKRSREYVISR